MVPGGSIVMLELVLVVHSYHVIAYPGTVLTMRSLIYQKAKDGLEKGELQN